MKCWIYPGDAEKRERGSQNLVLTQQTLHWPLWEVVWRDAAAVDSTPVVLEPGQGFPKKRAVLCVGRSYLCDGASRGVETMHLVP
uniref:Uncharacterized protein n=1 Tax=Knipowitschia caucasica TaxID=637954 RepID=A0AAV2LCF3_KNICA